MHTPTTLYSLSMHQTCCLETMFLYHDSAQVRHVCITSNCPSSETFVFRMSQIDLIDLIDVGVTCVTERQGHAPLILSALL